jgi:hypothetical protein
MDEYPNDVWEDGFAAGRHDVLRTLPTREQLVAVIDDAPHGETCNFGARLSVQLSRECTCWKVDLLALFTEPAPDPVLRYFEVVLQQNPSKRLREIVERQRAEYLAQPVDCCSRPGDPNWHTADGSHVVPPDVEEDTPVDPPTPSAGPCPRCIGRGHVGLTDCHLCQGTGKVLNAAIPPSIADMAPMDLAAQTAVVRDVDAEYMDEGGSTRHWVQALNRAGYVIARDPSTIRDVVPPNEKFKEK